MLVSANERVSNPRLDLLRPQVESVVLNPFRLHGWSVEIVNEIGAGADCIIVNAKRDIVSVQIAVLSTTAIGNSVYHELADKVEYIFYNGAPYHLESYAYGVSVPIGSLRDEFPSFLISMNKRVYPDCSLSEVPRRHLRQLRITSENPLESIFLRLRQFTSAKLAANMIKRRAEASEIRLPDKDIEAKGRGVAYLMRNALDYVRSAAHDSLNRKIVSLYYGSMNFAQAEILASPSGPACLDKVESVTKRGHGLYAVPLQPGGVSGIRIGVLAHGFLPHWMKFLGHNTGEYPNRRLSPEEIKRGEVSAGIVCSLQDVFASIPEIDDLFMEVYDRPPGWVSIFSDSKSIRSASGGKRIGSTYCLISDHSGKVTQDCLLNAGWPITEIQRATDEEYTGIAHRVRVDHMDHDHWEAVLPLHRSPFKSEFARMLILPTIGGLTEYRTIAFVILYTLSIMVRYQPSIWMRVVGGDEDQYLALVHAVLTVLERILPEHFLESITEETVRSTQPGSWLA